MNNSKKHRNVMNSLILVLQLGISFIVPILMCTAIFYYVGEWLDNSNITIIGIIIGIAAAFNGAYRQLKGFLKAEESPGQRARRLEEENGNKVDKET